MPKQKLAFCVAKDSPVHKKLLQSTVRLSSHPAMPGAGLSLEDLLISCCFLDRSFCETEAYFKQLIPYVMVTRVTDGVKQVLTYVRGSASGEDRLKARLSIGFGGHMDNFEDWLSCLDRFSTEEPLTRFVKLEAFRELHEEISGLDVPESLCYHGVLDDDSEGTVHSVHLGLLFEISAPTLELATAEPDTITEMAWVDVSKLLSDNVETHARLELWSQRALPKL